MSKDDQLSSLSEQDDKHPAPGEVKPGDGLYASGDVVTGGGDFVGHDKHVHGDEVHGDKVMGDKVVIQQAPKLRIPLERPSRAAHFQGRRDALDKLLADLHPGRVVTLCGPGGIGKTALAAEAVWQLAPDAEPSTRFPDGIVFHSFYNQPQVDLALEHIARSFGEEIKPSPKVAAQRALAGRRALIILDGTEQADDLRLVTDIRDQCSVLITSRTRQDEIEKRLDVDPLSLADAVTLVQAWGSSRATDTIAVRKIADLIGRLPLALRLVGRYLAENEEDAGDYLVWLKETPLSALNQGQRREQSVPLLLAHSLAQVSEPARQALSVVGLLALAPFAYEPVAVTLALSALEVRRSLGELINYGLLLRPSELYEVTHTLIHTYARHQLELPAEMMDRLAAYYTALINKHTGEFPLLNLIRPHVLALLHISTNWEARDNIGALAWTIDNYLDIQGYWTDRLTALKVGLIVAQSLQIKKAESGFLSKLGSTYWNLGEVEQAIAYYQQAISISREISDRRGEGEYLSKLGTTYLDLGQAKRAIMYHQQAISISQQTGDRRSEGKYLSKLGTTYLDLGEVEQAITHHQQAISISQQIGDRHSEGNHLGSLGNAYRKLGQIKQAIVYYQQAIAIFRQIGNRVSEGIWLNNLGTAYSNLGEVEQAITHYQQAIAIFREVGDRRRENGVPGNLGNAYSKLGQVEQAIAYYQQAIAISRQIGDRRGEGMGLNNLGTEYSKLGQIEQAIAYHRQAIVISQQTGNRHAEGYHLGILGSTYLDRGEVEQAIVYYQQAIATFREIGDRRAEGIWLKDLGTAYSNLGEVEQALQVWQQALFIFEEIKSPDTETVRKWLKSLNKT